MNYIESKFISLCNTTSDINEHLPILYKYSTECESIFETGVRGVVSTWAFVYGLLKNNKEKKYLFINDIVPCDINELLLETTNTSIKINYEWKNNLLINFNETFDLTFIDTWHVYGQLKRELDKFARITNKYIIMHDTTVDEWFGETVRIVEWDANKQSQETGIPVDEITKGLWPAIEEFLQCNKEWILHERYTNNNGLTILKRITL
jgi:hypothetical protein